MKIKLSNILIWIISIYFVYLLYDSYKTRQHIVDIIDSIKQELSIEKEDIINQFYIHNSIKDSITYYLIKYEIEHPDIALRQFILETGHFTSNAFIKYNNAGGMGKAALRYSTAVSRNGGLATYNSLEDFVIDYKHWQLQNASDLPRSKYWDVLTSIYAEDKYYIYKLKRIKL